MNQQILMEELLALLEKTDIQIRTEPLGGSGGGLCNVRGQNIFFVDSDAPAGETAILCAEAVGRLLDIDTIYIKPQVRQFIEMHTHSNSR
jgi:hypothetical protein